MKYKNLFENYFIDELQNSSINNMKYSASCGNDDDDEPSGYPIDIPDDDDCDPIFCGYDGGDDCRNDDEDDECSPHCEYDD